MAATDLSLIRDVSDVLKRLISENIPELTQKVTLDSPAETDTQPSSEDKLSLFLYQITENPYLKNRYEDAQHVSADGKTVNVQYPPMALDLFYLLTPFFKDKDKEQIVTTKLIRLMYDNSTISGTFLGDSLLQSGNKELRIEMSTLSLEQLSQLWGMFAGKAYRVGVTYIVTPLMVPSQRELGREQRVTTKQADYYYYVEQSTKKGM